MRKLLLILALLLACVPAAVAQPGSTSIYVYATSLSGVKCSPDQRALWIIKSGGSAGVYRCSATDTFTAVGSSFTFSSPTTGRLSKFASSTSLSNSLLSDDGTNTSLVSGQFIFPTTTQLTLQSGSLMSASNASGIRFYFSNSVDALRLANTFCLGWESTSAGGSSPDALLCRDGAAGAFAFHNSTNPARIGVYNTLSGANYERFHINWSGNTVYVGTTSGGTGVQRGMILVGATLGLRVGAAAAAGFDISSAGHLAPIAPNTYDLCNATNTCRTGFFGTSVVSPLISNGGSGPVELRTTTADSVIFTTNNTSKWLVSALGHYLPVAAGAYTVGDSTHGIKQLFVDATITAGGTTGAQTINKGAGSVNVAAGAASLVVTNSYVTANSIIDVTARTNDATCQVKNYVPAAGSFTINMTANCTAETSVGFHVINQ